MLTVEYGKNKKTALQIYIKCSTVRQVKLWYPVTQQ